MAVDHVSGPITFERRLPINHLAFHFNLYVGANLAGGECSTSRELLQQFATSARSPASRRSDGNV